MIRLAEVTAHDDDPLLATSSSSCTLTNLGGAFIAWSYLRQVEVLVESIPEGCRYTCQGDTWGTSVRLVDLSLAIERALIGFN